MSGVISRRLRLQAVGKGGTPSPYARHNTTPFSDWQPQLSGEISNANRRRLDRCPRSGCRKADGFGPHNSGFLLGRFPLKW